MKSDPYQEQREDKTLTPEDKEFTLEPPKPCNHYFYIEGQDIKCKHCPNGWPLLARLFTVKEGQLVSR